MCRGCIEGAFHRAFELPRHQPVQLPALILPASPRTSPVLPSIKTLARDTQKTSHQGNRVSSLLRIHQLEAFRWGCLEAKKALAFPKNSFSISNCLTRRRSAAFSAARSAGLSLPLLSASRRSRSAFTHRPTNCSPKPKSRATDAIVALVSITCPATSRRYSGVNFLLCPTRHSSHRPTHPLDEVSTIRA